MLTAHLGRVLSEDEFSAVASIWRQEGRTGVAAVGNRVLREAHARFAIDANPALRRRVRRITAGRWLLSSIALARVYSFAEAARHLGYSLLWHPGGLSVGIAYLSERLLVRVRRTIVAALGRP